MTSNDKTQETAGAVISQIADKRKEKAQSKLRNKNAVVRFKKKWNGKKYTYVALFADGRWWTTALGREGVQVNVKSLYSNDQFLELMAHPDVSKIEVATDWAPVQ